MEDVDVKPTSARTGLSRRSEEQEQLAQRVIRAVQLATGGRIHKIEVEVLDTSIRLRGFCATFHCNQLAQTAAMEVAGELHVDNQIVVW
ncbi:MAG: hypothetical protein DWQ35_03520 [Planctomycetota bacterium]|nr:MAG: hypothetical protein DWQ35_03520 [Planctomycetota bacterium]REK24031.1 MAG: hypothetical protein DWQ42_13835 [Planctomycetota bacterium]REK39362.1 MAG: hypothetical protein DWQ46_18990 [Planctomycetota bacterium]